MFIYTFLLLLIMKKKRNIGLVYFLAFTFLVLCIFGGFGFYDNSITGAATIDAGPISDAIEGVLAILFTGFLAPLTKVFGGDDYQVAVRLVLGIVLYVLISFGIGKKFDKQEGNQGANKNGRIISLVIAILGASLMPSAVIDKLFNPESSIFGNFLGWILVFVIIVLPIYLLAKTEAKNRMGHFFKGAVYLVLILIITYIFGSFGDLLKTGGIFDLVYGLSVMWCLGGCLYHLYNAAVHSARAVGEAAGRGGRKATESLIEAGGIRAQPRRVGGFLKKLWGEKEEDEGDEGGIPKVKRKPTILGDPQPEYAQQTQQQQLINNLKKSLSFALSRYLPRVESKIKDKKRWGQLNTVLVKVERDMSNARITNKRIYNQIRIIQSLINQMNKGVQFKEERLTMVLSNIKGNLVNILDNL